MDLTTAVVAVAEDTAAEDAAAEDLSLAGAEGIAFAAGFEEGMAFDAGGAAGIAIALSSGADGAIAGPRSTIEPWDTTTRPFRGCTTTGTCSSSFFLFLGFSSSTSMSGKLTEGEVCKGAGSTRGTRSGGGGGGGGSGGSPGCAACAAGGGGGGVGSFSGSGASSRACAHPCPSFSFAQGWQAKCV